VSQEKAKNTQITKQMFNKIIHYSNKVQNYTIAGESADKV